MGAYLHPNATNPKGWRVDFMFRGRRFKHGLFPSRKSALDWEADKRRALANTDNHWPVKQEVPVRTLRLRDLEWLRYNYCKHGYSYLAHYDCYIEERPRHSPMEEKIGFLDIETGNLHADFGYIFSYAIKARGKARMYGRVLKTSEIRNYTFDRDLMREFCRHVRMFDRVVVHWGKDRRHDLPFLRTRVLKHQTEARGSTPAETKTLKAELQFPFYRDVYLQDTFDMSKNKLRLASNRLENICRVFGVPAKAHKMDPNKWQRALAGCPKSLRHIWLHNKEDVISLEAVFELLHRYVPKSKTSI